MSDKTTNSLLTGILVILAVAFFGPVFCCVASLFIGRFV